MGLGTLKILFPGYTTALSKRDPPPSTRAEVPIALPLCIPRCIHLAAHQYHFPPLDQPLRIQIEGPLVAIQNLLPHIPWRLGLLNGTFPQPAGPELARLTYRTIYGRDFCHEVRGDLVVRDEYLGWMPDKYPEQ